MLVARDEAFQFLEPVQDELELATAFILRAA